MASKWQSLNTYTKTHTHLNVSYSPLIFQGKSHTLRLCFPNIFTAWGKISAFLFPLRSHKGHPKSFHQFAANTPLQFPHQTHEPQALFPHPKISIHVQLQCTLWHALRVCDGRTKWLLLALFLASLPRCLTHTSVMFLQRLPCTPRNGHSSSQAPPEVTPVPESLWKLVLAPTF